MGDDKQKITKPMLTKAQEYLSEEIILWREEIKRDKYAEERAEERELRNSMYFSEEV